MHEHFETKFCAARYVQDARTILPFKPIGVSSRGCIGWSCHWSWFLKHIVVLPGIGPGRCVLSITSAATLRCFSCGNAPEAKCWRWQLPIVSSRGWIWAGHLNARTFWNQILCGTICTRCTHHSSIQTDRCVQPRMYWMIMPLVMILKTKNYRLHC